MNQNVTKNTNSLIVAAIVHFYIGWGFLFISKIATGHLTNNAYLGLIPASLIALPFIWIIVYLAKLFPGKNISTIFGLVFGKFLGTVISIIHLLYLFSFESMPLLYGQKMVHTYFFERTPFFILPTIILICGTYLALNGFLATSRLAAFMLIPPLMIILGLEMLGLVNINSLNIQPILTASPLNWLLSGTDLVMILLPTTAPLLFLPFISSPNNVKKIGITSFAISFPILFLAIMGYIGAFGPTIANKNNWAIVEYFHIIDYPFLLLEKAGLFFLVAWYIITTIAIALGLFLFGNELHIIIPQINRKWLILGFSLMVLLVVNVKINASTIDEFMIKYQKLIAFSYLSIIFITWSVAKIRFKTK